LSRIVLLTDDETAADGLRSLAGTGVNLVERLPVEIEGARSKNVICAIPTGGAMVVVVGPDIDLVRTGHLARLLETMRPDVAVVLWAEPTSEVLTIAVDVGARGIIAPHGSEEEVRECLRKAVEFAERLAGVNGAANPAGSSVDVCRVIAVVSPKGGTGKTTVSTNIALTLAAAAPGEVVIVDLDLQFGDVEYALRLQPEYTMADAVRSGTSLDATEVKGYLTSHPSQVYALCAPPNPAEADGLDAVAVGQVVDLLATQFRYVVLDTGGGIDDHTLNAIDRATDVVLVVATDVPTVRSAQKSLAVFKQLGHDDRPWHVVLNRSDAKVGLGPADVEEAIGMSTDARIPESRAFGAAMNHGSPVVECQPKSSGAKSIVAFCDRFLPAVAPRRRLRESRGMNA
jgi:pilus assembly protein CpaE